MDDLTALLHAAGRTLATQRAWVLEKDGTPPPPGSGPGFVYRWDAEGPLAIRFHPDGGAIFGNAGRSFAIEMDGTGLRLLAPGSSPRSTAPLPPESLARYRDLIRRTLAAAAEPGPHRDLTLTASAMQLVVLALDAIERPSLSPRELARQELAARLHRWLENNLNPPPGPADAAAALEISPRGLTRVLQASTGMGFAGHLAVHRLLAARRMTIRTERPVGEIAGRCGFSSHEPLIRAFNGTFGWTPLQFRKAWNQAIRNEGDLRPLCRFAGRLAAANKPPDDNVFPAVWTLVVANALHEFVEIQREAGETGRAAVLERGEMTLLPRCESGSVWNARAACSERRIRFVMPAGHATFVVVADSTLSADADEYHDL